MPKIRLLHVCTVPQTLTFLDSHVAHARAQGWEVHAVAAPGRELDEFAARTGAIVHAVAMSRQITPLRDLRSLWNLRRLLRQIRPTIVHGYTPKGGLLAMLVACFCRAPVRVYHLFGLPLETATGMRRLLLSLSEKTSCRLAHQVLCISDSLRTSALNERLCPPEKIKVLHHGSVSGVDAAGTYHPIGPDGDSRITVRAEHGIPAEALVLGFVGRVVRDKGVVELARTWQTLRGEFPHVHLLIVGPTEAHDPPPAEIEALRTGDERVHWTGEVEVTRVHRYYRALDLVVLPTYREGFGTVLLEAAALELPVVATRVPGCLDAVIDGQTGTLVPPRNVEALAEAVRAYLRDGERRRQHGLAGRARVVRDFDPMAFCAAQHTEYLLLLRDKGVSLPALDEPQPNGAVRPAASFYRRRGKRLFDVAASAGALLLLAPLLLVLAVLVRCFLGAPILFRQRRSGRGKQPFTILKFRSMTEERDIDGALLPESRRLTRFGRLLRSSSLDELPELLNVLKGDMSLVGPRPLLPQYDPYYSTSEDRRFELLPGITGWAQINGRNDLAWDERLACDIWYAEHCSLGLDLKIMLRTIGKVLRRDNIQVDPGQTFGTLDEERRRRAEMPARTQEGTPS